MKTLYPFQVIGRDFLARRTSAFLCDDMGLGKTPQSIEAAKALGLTSGLIICPLAVRRSWVKQLREQFPSAFVKEIRKKSDEPEPNAINVINYDIIWRSPLKAKLYAREWSFIIMDEGHFLKAWDSRRTMAVLGKQGIAKRCRYRWVLTGTPILNRPIELFPLLRALAPEHLGKNADYYLYAKRYCGAYQDLYGWNVNGASNLKELSMILAPVMLRRTKQEVLTDLPPIIFDKVYVDPTDKLILANRALEQEIGEILSLRRAVGVLKVGQTIEHIKTVLETKSKIVVFTFHKEVVKQLHEAFPKSVLYTGDENAKEKEDAITKFIEDPGCQIFFGNIKAAGFGIDGLQRVCDHCIFAEVSYVPGEMSQAMDRIYRIGQVLPVTVQFVVVEDSLEEGIINSVTAKCRNIKTILQEGGEIKFIGVQCSVCKSQTEIKDAVRVAKLTVCKKCKTEMECFL